MKRFIRNNYKLIFGLLSLAVLSLGFSPSPTQAQSEPKTEYLTPIPPDGSQCWLYLELYGKELSRPNGQPAVAQAGFYACMQQYGGDWNDYMATVNDYWYRRSKQIQQSFEFQVKLAGWGAAMDSISFLTTKFASDAANYILGVDTPEGQSSFFEDSFGDSLKYAGDNAAGVFFERFDAQVNEFRANTSDMPETQNSSYFGFTTLCKKPSPLDIKMGLGLGPLSSLDAPTCTLSAMMDNFEAISDMVSSGDALNIHKATFTPQGDDLSVGLEVHADYVDSILEAVNAKKLERQETQGMRPFADKITGKIQWPSMMGNESIKNLDPVGMSLQKESDQAGYMFDAYWQTGLEGIGVLTLSTFLNRLAFGFLNKLFNPDIYTSGFSEGTDPAKYNITYQNIINEDASGDTQNYYERQAFAKALGDFIVPNYFTSDDKDLTSELSTCPSMRSKWNCAMDQQLAIAINLGTNKGALTIGKASGIGNENSRFTTNNQGLHVDWELIPESDIVNNSDPSCYQRAYCAGNLKKLRLARILPVGFEMAANSPYNVKRAGKYATLGDVIRGFYDCNDDGEIDKDHPWCHLINPNWILAAPKYQCRSKGFGDTLMPELGTRQEECGDVVTCLGTNQKGECTDGYGYCLAERTAYKFDAPECKEQYASCRTYQSSQGETLSALRYTVERSACSSENIGCMWYATNRYVTSTASPDGLWEGTITEGNRIYLDGGAESCSSEGCTKVYNVNVGESAFNLINNSSFEQVTEVEQNGSLSLQGIDSWSSNNAVYQNINTTEESYDGTRSITLDAAASDMLYQVVPLEPNRNYMLSFYFKSKINYGSTFGHVNMDFFNKAEILSQNRITAEPANFEDCYWDAGGNRLTFKEIPGDQEWHRLICQFVSPKDVAVTRIYINLADFLYIDAIELEEGEYVTDYVEELAELDESHIKIAPDEYACTGNDDEDHPACTNFARVCRQTEVGCQGYTDVNDPTAPEIPATLTAKDYCPSVCSGYGEYRKLASSFDLVYNPVYPEYSDPADDGKAYLIPGTSQSCTLQNVGCEPFTSLEASSQGGEQIAYYDSLRTCEKPNDLSRTYFTWEGSDAEGYVLRTWALIANSDTDNTPKVVLKGAVFGDIKDPDSCNEDLWDSGIDQDCRQFYDEAGTVYYAYYSQTVSSDDSCTLYRKDDSSEVDCSKTGGYEFVPQSGSCLYYALPSESSICPATAGGCRAYLGPTGRNAVQTYYQSFVDDGSEAGYTSGLNSTISRSEESVLVGDYSLKIDSVGGSNIQFQTDISLITTTTLYRISFWAKSFGSDEVSVSIDGEGIGSFAPTTIWQRFEIGPFEVEDTTSTLAFSAPSSLGSLFIDTIKLDQLNDIRFLVKNSWTIPAACDATVEGTPEPRAMLGCNEYIDRDGNQIFARNFSNLCRADSIGCKAFIDTRSVANPYPESRTIAGTPGPSTRNDGDAKAYEEQYLGDWSITSQPWRYYYAIDDSRARCDSSEDSCRAFGKPRFAQDRLSLKSTEYAVDQNDTELLQTQDTIYEFETVLLKHNWDAYYNSDGSLGLACRKDELHCDKFQSGNVTEYFRNPGDHTCEWRDAKQLDANPDIGIYTDGAYGGWFRKGTDTPCYPGDNTESPPKAPYLKGGDNFGAYFTGEDPYAGWVSGCPVDQSECTEFIDPNDTSDQTKPYGRSYFLINSNKLDTRSCGYQADPLAGCVLFNNKSINTLQANSKATYQKSIDERGAAQEPVDCKNDPGNPYCKVCINFAFGDTPQGFTGTNPAEILSALIYNQNNSLTYTNQLLEYEQQLQKEGFTCNTNQDCLAFGDSIFADGQAPTNLDLGYVAGTCGRENDSNVIIKVKLDRECARWMGCSTAETVFDPAQQKYVNKCNELELCEKNGSRNEDIFCAQFTDRSQESLLKEGQFIDLKSYSARTIEYGSIDYSGYTIPNQYLITDIVSHYVGRDLMTDTNLQERYSLDKRLVAEIPMDNQFIEEYDDTGSGTGAVCRDFELVECAGYGCNAYYDDIKSSIGKACNSDNDCYVYEHDMQYTAQGNCGLSLCRDTRSGLVGYQDLIKNTCILAVSSPSAMSLVASGQTGGDLSRNADSIYNQYIQENIGNNNVSLQSAMPAPECQLYPEAGSPLPNEYVESWKSGTNPPIPEKMLSGYEGAKACVYGEDCSCSYRKVRYANGIERYYSIGGKAPSVGICVGGDMDGQACVPGGYVPVDSQNRVLITAQQADLMQQSQTCTGGICSPIQDVVVQNGQYGYCLERDRTRIGTSNQITAPCLTWSPQVVIGGTYDTTHYSPTAGYLPPQGSGEYYCTSGANEQKLVKPTVQTKFNGIRWESENFRTPGSLERMAYSLPNVWGNSSLNEFDNKNIDGKSNGGKSSAIDNLTLYKRDPKTGEEIDPKAPQPVVGGQESKTMEFACRRAALCSGYPVSEKINEEFVGSASMPWASDGAKSSDLDSNPFEGRWITTGSGPTKSYLEYFVISTPGIYGINEKEFDYRYGLFRFTMKPYSVGAACKWNPAWAGQFLPNVDDTEDFQCGDYLSKIESLSNEIYQQVSQGFSGVLDRSSESILLNGNGEPVKLTCIQNNGYNSNEDNSCYYKYWEVGYRDTDQQKFQWIDTVQKDPLDKFSIANANEQYYARECSSKNPYFSIRAMFENVNYLENDLPIEEARSTKLSGPWQFVGFWITACSPTNNADDPAHLYMELDYVKSDVCREVSQVVSPTTRENAAFADRIWSLSNFILPTLGLDYDTRNEPFASALAADKIGNDPMLMGVSVPISGSFTKAPSFVDSGVSIQSVFNSQNSWAPLSNLFARVYKVYRWAPYMVTKGDWACITGSKMGFLCPSNSNAYDGIISCGDYASCNEELDKDMINQLWRCNSLSGVNRGLECGQKAASVRNTDPVCHNAAVYFNPNDPDSDGVPLYSTCQPGNLSQKNLLAFKLDTEEYLLDDPSAYVNKPVMKDIRFKAVKCSNSDTFYAQPIDPGLSGRVWNDPLVLLYGLLRLGTIYSDESGYETVEIDPCTQGSSGELTKLLEKMRTNIPMREAFANVLPSQVNTTGINNLTTWQETIDKYTEDWQRKNQYYSLGAWETRHLRYLIDYRCDSKSVNYGHRCLPGDNVGLNGEYGDYTSVYCPQKITACPSGATNSDPDGDGIPNCGLCEFTDDEYKDLYKYEGQQTGHCQNFNPFSRCTTNADCTFTDFEYWGAYDNENPDPLGESINDLDSKLPFLYGAEETLNLENPPIPLVNLPRPTFLPSLYQNEEKLGSLSNVPYDIPLKYSEPTVVSTFTNTGKCALKAFSGYICEDIKQEIVNIHDQNPGHISAETEKYYDYIMGINHDSSWIYNVGSLGGLLPWIGGHIDDLFTSGSEKVKEETVGLMMFQLGDDYYNCYSACMNSARTVPNGYAAHFEEIAETSKNKKYKSATIAPFIVDTLYREVRSLGFQTVKTDSYSEYEEDEDYGGESSIQGRQVISYFVKGYWYSYLWKFMLEHAKINGDGAGDQGDGFEDAENSKIYHENKAVAASEFAVTSDFSNTQSYDRTGAFMDDYAKDIGQVGFSHRLNNLGKETLINDEIPWNVNNFYFTSEFPLMFKNEEVSQMYNSEFKYNKTYHIEVFSISFDTEVPITAWRLANKIIRNLGISEDLVNSMDKYFGNLSEAVNYKGSDAEAEDLNWKNTADALTDFKDSYQKDFGDNFVDRTGWGALLKDDFKELKLFPGAVPVVQPAEGKDIPPLYLPGHCEPPKNGTDYDSVNADLKSVNTALEQGSTKWWSKYGRPNPKISSHADNGSNRYWWANQRSDFRAMFITAWEDVIPFKEQGVKASDGVGVVIDGSTWALYSGGNQWGNSPIPRFCDHVVNTSYESACDASGYTNPEDHEFVNALLDINTMKIGDDIKISGPTGAVSDYRTTCRCDGGKFDGQPKGSVEECNQGLADEDDPRNYDPNASYIEDPSDYCKPVSKADGTPQDYCRTATGIPDHPDPDLDNNWCTHRPSYIPRGDVCADGRDNCLTTYDLTSYLSTNNRNIVTNMSSTPKTAPSATDVTSGLDSYKFITSTYDPYEVGRDHINKKNFTVYYRPRPPRIAAPDSSRQSSSANTLPVSSMDTFSLDGLANGLAYYGGGQGLSTIRFYAWAMHDQGPIKEIIIDWGDGTHQVIDNAQLKNRKPVCNSTRECEFIEGYACTSDADCPPAGGACLEKGTCKKKVYQTCDSDDDCGTGDECETRMFFGNSTEACQQGYFEFTHVYQCSPQSVLELANEDKICDKTGLCENEPGLTCSAASDCRPGEECVFNQLAEPNGCYNQQLNRCRYTPRIMVIDNWGWCTGDCSRGDEVKPGDTTNLSKSELIRHPYGGCWDGSETKINSEVGYKNTQDPYYGSTMPNECKPYFEEVNYFTRSTYQTYRPWVVFDGSVEVGQPNYIELKSDGLGNFNLYYMYKTNKSNNPILPNNF